MEWALGFRMGHILKAYLYRMGLSFLAKNPSELKEIMRFRT
jgi:hypothetical protein